MSLLKEDPWEGGREGRREGGVKRHAVSEEAAHMSEVEGGREGGRVGGGEEGTVRVRGSLAYVPQTAWVPNEAFR